MEHNNDPDKKLSFGLQNPADEAQKTTDEAQGTPAAPQKTTAAPQNAPAEPQDTPAAPQNLTGEARDAPDEAQDMPAELQNATAAPQDAPAASQSATSAVKPPRSRAKSAARRAANGGLFIALAFTLSFFESMIPSAVIAPGVKLGIANLVTVFALYRMRTADLIVITAARVVLAGFAFGGGFSIAYGLSGAALSLAVMLLLKRSGRFSPVAVSAAGGVAHNIGQIICACLAMGTSLVLGYLPVLFVSGTLAGALVGVAAGVVIKNISPHRRDGEEIDL